MIKLLYINAPFIPFLSVLILLFLICWTLCSFPTPSHLPPRRSMYSWLGNARSTLIGYNISSGLAEPSYCFPLLRGSASHPLIHPPTSRNVFSRFFFPHPPSLSYNLITTKAARTVLPRYILDFPSLETFCSEKLYLGAAKMREGWGTKMIRCSLESSICSIWNILRRITFIDENIFTLNIK